MNKISAMQETLERLDKKIEIYDEKVIEYENRLKK